VRELIKSMIGFSWALSLFGARRIGDLLVTSDACQATDRAAAPLASVTGAAAEQMNEILRDAFQTGDRMQRRMVDAVFDVLPSCESDSQTQSSSTNRPISTPQAGRAPAVLNEPVMTQVKVHSGRLDITTFIVLGEGLAAGMGDFALSADTQRDSFPAQMARQMQTPFAQPLIQPPGISQPPGFAQLPVIVPAALQTSVLEDLSSAAISNLSVPGMTLCDALSLRPVEPLVHRRDAKQTAVNLFWSLPALSRGEKGALPTQIEYAVRRGPTFVIIELGYCELLEAAIRGDISALPDFGSFCSDYARLLAALKEAGAELLVLTIPDPMDTACFSSLDLAAKILKVEPDFLRGAYGLSSDELITVNGLNEIGFQLFARAISFGQPLPAGSALSAEVGNQISSRVGELNVGIDAIAQEHGAISYDLHALFRRLRREGIGLGSRRLTAEYLGGFYSLNGCYPGATGQAIIANELLHLLNRVYGADFCQIDLQAVMSTDPVAAYRQAPGPYWTADQLSSLARPSVPQPPATESARTVDRKHVTVRSSPASAAPLAPEHTTSSSTLQLPPGLEQVLPLSQAASYFGDGIAALNCRDEQGIQWGSCGSLLFGGLAMVDSHLSGHLRIKFTSPVGDLTRFEVSFLDGLAGDDAVLVTPQYFKMAFQQSRVDDVPGQVSSGTLNLATGEVSDLKVYARYSSTALLALVSVNPTFPKQPLSFPGPYGSAWAKFEQRPDGNLDFTFYGSAFVPLGKDILWPLNFAGPSLQFATIPAAGTVMHPHLHLSTKEPVAPSPSDDPPEIPFNTVQELTLYTHNSSFGDAFTLNAPELGGPAKGRSHILGRVQLQFGVRCGDSVPVAISNLDAGGILQPMEASPITAVFPGRLYHGPRGFNEFLRFPLRTYSLDDLAILDDPFDIAIGMVDLKTGRFMNDLLHRGFINQDLIFALLRVEPRTPKDSFYFRGPARLEKGTGGEMVLRFQGIVRVPYPEGFLFPNPNLTTGIPIGSNSVLDPFLWIRAIGDDTTARAVKEGRADGVLSSAGERFSYRYRVSGDPAQEAAMFEYENHTQQGAFRLHSLSWVGFGNSLGSLSKPGEYDTVTFTGFGLWHKDGVESLQQAAVQVSTSPITPYIGIQIGSGDVSDVNTKPMDEHTALP
jgi:hypothetical protein